MVSPTPAKFGGRRHCGGGDMFSVYHVMSKDHVIHRSCDFMGGTPSWQVKSLPNLVVLGILVVEIFLNCYVIL